jgi:hypothetical protein
VKIDGLFETSLAEPSQEIYGSKRPVSNDDDDDDLI